MEPLPQPVAAGERGQTSCPVSSHTEWDPLEEVVVGRLEGATIPPGHVVVTSNVRRPVAMLCRLGGGARYPRFLTRPAQRELDEFIHVLEAEGVTVRRPDPIDFSVKYRTRYWSSRGFCSACPRDAYLVVGNEIIEAPQAWPCRYFEVDAYRSLFKEYFRQGARWTAAPKPQLRDELYDRDYEPPGEGHPMRYVINEFEPVFDAADFVRCGRDIFALVSNVTNRLGIEWLRRHLGEAYLIHEIESRCRWPMHIDTTIMPLAPGKILVNPEYIDPARLPRALRSWDLLIAPEPDPVPGLLHRCVTMCSKWLSMNVLALDERRVLVERSQCSMAAALRDWSFEPIPCAFNHYAPFGGSFHCATLDVRRRGTLQCWCDSIPSS